MKQRRFYDKKSRLADLTQKLQEKNATPEQTLRAKKLLLASLEHFVARNDDEYLGRPLQHWQSAPRENVLRQNANANAH